MAPPPSLWEVLQRTPARGGQLSASCIAAAFSNKIPLTQNGLYVGALVVVCGTINFEVNPLSTSVQCAISSGDQVRARLHRAGAPLRSVAWCLAHRNPPEHVQAAMYCAVLGMPPCVCTRCLFMLGLYVGALVVVYGTISFE